MMLNTTASNQRHKKGFALIASLSIMAVLVLIGVALFSLSSVATKSASIASARVEAQANAKAALMLALGELQKSMGPDQRISANAAIFDTDRGTSTIEGVNHPRWVGVWDSWIAGDINDAPVDPTIYPSAASEHQTIGSPTEATLRAGMAPAYSEKEDHFRKWLVSLDPNDQKDFSEAGSSPLSGDPTPLAASTAVRMVGNGSLGPDAMNQDYVSAGLLEVEGNGSSTSGRYAWWIGDESQKATIMPDAYSSAGSLSDAERIYRSQAPDQMGNDLLPGFGNISDKTQLDKILTFKSLDLLDPVPADNAPTLSQLNFHSATLYNYGVLADVREGGLKRDLNTLLERPINLNDDGDEFMLYDFNRAGETVLDERVPIQDLAAFYQLYRDSEDFSNGGRGGVKYTSDVLNNKIQIQVPDYGDTDNKDKYLRQYTALYRNPVPVKIQFILGVGASDLELTPQQEIDYAGRIRPNDDYKLTLGVMPVVSLWNPNNLPMVMDTSNSQEMRVSFPPFHIQWKKYRALVDEDGDFESRPLNLSYAISNESTGDLRARRLSPYIMSLHFANKGPIIFEPGEVKMFSINYDFSSGNYLLETDGEAQFFQQKSQLYDAKKFEPYGFYVAAKSAGADKVDPLDVIDVQTNKKYAGTRIVFADGDKFTIAVYPEAPGWSRAVSRGNEIYGSGFQFYMADADYNAKYGGGGSKHFRNYQFISQFGGGNDPNNQKTVDFNSELMLSGFPGGEVIPFEAESEAIPGMDIKDFTDNNEVKALLMFSMMPGCEVNNVNTGGFSAGRRITTRPFLHGSTLSAPQIAENSPTALYDYGWEWQVERIYDTAQAFQDDGNSRGYHGGGYTVEAGTTNVVQQYLPVLPPISIASLSSAHLGGYSLANAPVMADSGDVSGGTLRTANGLGDFRQTTATGQGGLAPHTLQAVGNAYAHPNILPDQAFTTYIRRLNMDQPEADQVITYVDHSYLANKALWDDFFFSSISPQFKDVQLQKSDNKTAFEVAEDFLFNGQPLPNRRMVANPDNLDSEDFDLLGSQYEDFTDGFADKIASYLLLNGPFNINSTSVEAWTVLLSSLRDKSIAYLDDDTSSVAAATSSDQTLVAPGMLPNGQPPSISLSNDTNNPIEQWVSMRGLSDDEIAQLAQAIVYQVKRRGPFLSLSEFVNRRLEDEGDSLYLASKGALQAALDFDPNVLTSRFGEVAPGGIPEVTINTPFRTPARSLDTETAGISFPFQEAAEGPVAYGSTPYIDQADILRHLGSVLTPRGDTFVIRTYGDKLNPQGEVVARAWCEAVVQRTPDYLDLSNDENHFAQERLNSQTNKNFGRKFKIISFRWLNEDEV